MHLPNKMLGADALNTLVAWVRRVRDLVANWFARGTRAAERKKTQRRDTDQRLRREAGRESTREAGHESTDGDRT